MKIFSKIRHTNHRLGSNRAEIHTHYFLFNWNFWTSKKQETTSRNQEAQWTGLRQGADGYLEADEQSEYLGII